MSRAALVCAILMFMLLLPRAGYSQLAVGQYQDEAPLRSWNQWGFFTAASAGMGGIRFTLPFASADATTNPALLSRLPQLTISVEGSLLWTELRKFGVVNTGVIFTPDNTSTRILNIDYGGISMNYRGWAAAGNVYIQEIFDRPVISTEATFNGQVFQTFEFLQQGFIRTYNLAFSREVNSRLALGIGLNYEKGYLDKSWLDRDVRRDINISDTKTHDIEGYFINAGVLWELNDRWSLAAAARSPYTRKAESYSLIRNETPPGNTDIRIEVQDESRFRQPLAAGLGLSYQPQAALILAADLSFFNWRDYSAELFGEEVERRFNNSIVLNLGAQYLTATSLFNQRIDVPFWVGFSYDPQPMDQPHSRYYYLTFGFGIRWKDFFLDAGSMVGWENGSGDSLQARRIAVTLGYRRQL